MGEDSKDTYSIKSTSTSAFGVDQEHFSFLYKIDFYGTLFIIWLIWEIPYMMNSLVIDHLQVDVPYEMLVHGPLRYFPAVTNFDFRLNCSEFFFTFLNSPAFLTDDFMGDEITKIENECLQGKCFNRVYLCWWKALNYIRFVLFAHIGSFLPAIAVIILLMFDPPPAGFNFVARPWIAASSLCLSSFLGILYMGLFTSLVRKYLSQGAFYATYSGADGQPVYGYKYDFGYIYTFIGSLINLCYGCCYWYVYIFSPPYPRHPSRFENRRGYFLIQIEKLKNEYGVNKNEVGSITKASVGSKSYEEIHENNQT